LHTGEVLLRDEGNYVGPAINRTARLRDLAHGGQTVLSAATSNLVIDQLPDGSSLTDLGSHPLRDLPRLERVMQLCHPDIRNEFPPLRTPNAVVTENFPTHLTTFVGRAAETSEIASMLRSARLVTLTGAGGVGKTRLAIHVATSMLSEFGDGAQYVDLAPVMDPAALEVTVLRALGLSDQQGRSTMEILTRSIADRHMLLVLDNCEHQLDGTANLVNVLLGHCPRLTLLATSREPIAIAGEATWRVPSLSLVDEAIELFADRARLARADFAVTTDSAATVGEICRRLDGMPLAIELAAARVRALTLNEILDGLRDHFMLLTGGARTAVRRQQTLRASVDWSHALLSDTERVLFRRLAAFVGGFDLEAARAVASDDAIASHQVLDQLTLLVDKSLVGADEVRGRTQYRLLETVRQYAQEKLSDSGEAATVRSRHRDYYTAKAATLQSLAAIDRWRLSAAELSIDNLRAAFAWSRDTDDTEHALVLASMLWPLWISRGRLREGLAWFDAVFADNTTDSVQPSTLACALANRAALNAQLAIANPLEDGQRALELAREIGDPALIARALTACASSAAFDPAVAHPYISEAIALARKLGDRTMLAEALAWHGQSAFYGGNPRAGKAAAEEGLAIAEAAGDRYVARACRWNLAWADMVGGELVSAIGSLRKVAEDAAREQDGTWAYAALYTACQGLCYLGDVDAARTCEDEARAAAADAGYANSSMVLPGLIAIAAGDIDVAAAVDMAALRDMDRELAIVKIGLWRGAAVELARGDLSEARRWADDAVAATTGWHLAIAMTTRAKVAIAEGNLEQAERDLHAALAIAAEVGALLGVPDTLDTLAVVAAGKEAHAEAARLFGAAQAMRARTAEIRFATFQRAHDAAVDNLRAAMNPDDFESAWTDGAQLSNDEAIAYALRGKGERKRPSSGWESLTPAEMDVVRLVCEGLGNKEIAARLFVSPRTVQAHLSHVYTKLGIGTRVRLVQVAAQHQ
jgi:predicted ATPase/DNA-binding CsgD family transcriptional regulator